MNTPILFLIFNRPDTTRRVFESIRQAKPVKLFIAADGPRENKTDEKERCKKTREIVSKIDWPCEVKTLFRDTNLGCGRGVSGAINWFFENVEEGIILEDDCLPDPSFFPYCEHLLEQYRYDDNIYMISGGNYLPKSIRPKESYYFSRLPHIWGWASWRRSWQKYDFEMKDFSSFKKGKEIEETWQDKDIQNYFLDRFEDVYKKRLDTWDYQWNYCIWKQNGYSITPRVNLISNIGFGNEATHTLNKKDSSANIPLEKISFPLSSGPCEVYELGDNYENTQLKQKNGLTKKVLKKLGLFKVAKYVYLTLNKKLKRT